MGVYFLCRQDEDGNGIFQDDIGFLQNSTC